MPSLPDIKDWPNSEHSRFVTCRPHRWHVQSFGEGDTLLFLHGASGSSHSWRDVMVDLATDHHVVAVDLPGHGFTDLGSRHRSSLELMSQDLQSLIDDQKWQPRAIVAHSAGAALGLRLLQRSGLEAALIAVNPALAPFKGMTGVLFPMAARMVAMSPLIVNLIKRRMSGPGQVISLMDTTGSKISAHGMDLYARLFRKEAHVDGTLLMMAQWKLDGLVSDLDKIDVPCTFLVGEGDKAVPPASVRKASGRMKHAEVISLGPLGHLAHEEDPEAVANLVRCSLR